MGIPDHLTRLLRNLYSGQEETMRTGHGTIDLFRIQKGVWQGCKLLYPAYLTYIQSTSSKISCWMNHKPESKLLREISTTSDMQMTQEPLDEGQRGEWESWFKTQCSKTKVTASSPITSWKIDAEKAEAVTDRLYSLRLQNHCSQWLQPWY